ncbi:MAG: hypothetical protein RR523_15795 [Cetobacterium sp.]
MINNKMRTDKVQNIKKMYCTFILKHVIITLEYIKGVIDING